MDANSRGGDDPPVRALLSELSGELGLLLRKELELARVELRAKAGKAAQAAAAFAAAALGGLVALVFLSSAAAWALAEVMPAGLAFLLVAVIWLVVAGVGLVVARRRARRCIPSRSRPCRPSRRTSSGQRARGTEARDRRDPRGPR
jgi:MFS family permease